MLELGEKIKAVYSKPADYGEMEQDGDCYSVSHVESTKQYSAPTTAPVINRVVICEDLTDGQAVRGFKFISLALPNFSYPCLTLIMSSWRLPLLACLWIL